MTVPYTNTTAALISTLDDDYTLLLSVLSTAPHVDEVWIHDDGSRERTGDVLAFLKKRFSNVACQGTETSRGQVFAINSLLSTCRSRHILVLEADAVMYPGAGEALRRMVRDDYPFYRLGFLECWGDFRHSRRGTALKFENLVYLDRAADDFSFRQLGGPEYYQEFYSPSGLEAKPWREAILFHLPGARSDSRLAMRSMRRSFMRMCGGQDIHGWEKFSTLTREKRYARAMKYLFDGIRLTEIPKDLIPPLCLKHERFRIIFDASGMPAGREDRGWELREF